MSYTLTNIAALSDYDAYKNLPFCVYLTHSDGTILQCNDKAGKLLNIKESDLGIINIKHFYLLKSERKTVLDKLKKLKNGEWIQNETLTFKVEEKELSLRYFARAYKSQVDELIGSLCLVFEITGFERFRDFENIIPIGLFEVSEQNIITYRNEKFNEILGINNNDNNLRITDFFSSNEKMDEYKNYVRLLSKRETIKDMLVDLTTKDDKSIVGKFNVKVDIRDEFNKVYKAKGTLEDATMGGIFNDGFIGLFSLKRTKNSLKIEKCNKYFADLFNQNSVADCIGKTFDELVILNDRYQVLVNNILNLSFEDNLLKDFYIELSLQNGVKELVFHVIRQKDKFESNRYTGVVYDITNDTDQKLLDWKENFSAFLHTYSAMCNSVNGTLQSIINAHATDAVQDSVVNIELSQKLIGTYINSFKVHYENFFNIASQRANIDSLDLYIKKGINEIDSYENFSLKDNLALIRNFFSMAKKEIETHEVYKQISKEIKRDISIDVSEILRYVRLISLSFIEEEVYEMSHNIVEIQRAVLYGYTDPEYKKFDLLAVTRKAIQNHQEYAIRRNIQINFVANIKNSYIWGDSEDMYNALYNILNNAIKYTWSKPDGKKSSVKVVVEDSEDTINISFENRGVGISKEELSSGILFLFSRRGMRSTDKQRKGTGIGLWHSNKIITYMKGKISITSTSIDRNYPDDLSRPFITLVVINLPKKNV